MDLRAEEASPTQLNQKNEAVLLPRSPQLKSPQAKTSSMRKPVNGDTRRLLMDVTSPSKPLISKKKRVVPKLAANSSPKKRRATQNQWEDSSSDERQINAGVYVLENAKTGHCFFGTTWDLKNAAAQNFHDLQIGEHAHKALAKCYQLYGPEASGISFKVLERVAAPPAPVSSSRKTPQRGNTNTFDVKQLELQLQRRLLFHRSRRVRKCTQQLVRRRLIVPVLQTYWPRWCEAVAIEQNQEQLAASACIQTAWRKHAALSDLRQSRRTQAALQVQRFLRISVLKRLLQRRQRVRIQNASAVRIQRAIRGFLQRCRQLKRKALVRRWFQARKIQAVYRGHRGRIVVHALKRDIHHNCCAVQIQAQVRGHLARRLVLRLRCRLRDSLAAVIIQKRIRGVLARRSFYTNCERQNERRRRHEAAAKIQRVYWSFVHRKLQHVAKSLAIQAQGATTIRMAYRNFVAKKFGWAAATYALETTAAKRIQRAISRWYFFLGLRRQIAIHCRDKAARRIQRLVRGRAGRKQYLAMRHLQCQNTAAWKLQRLWASHHFWKVFGVLLGEWRRDKSAQIIQKHYRRHHTQQWVAHLRRDARRERAAITLQCAFRRKRAQRQWNRRLELQRMGPCDECGNELPAVFVFSVGLELCLGCWTKWQTHMSSPSATNTGKLLHETMDVHAYRSLRRLVVPVQRGYRRFQQRTAEAFGSCGFCDHNAVRTQCESCGNKRFCHTCDVLFHSKEPRSLHTRYHIEWTLKRTQAAVTLQAQFRRFQQRNTLKDRRDAKQSSAAIRIQRVYRSFHQRNVTRVMVVAWKQRQQDELQACLTIQRYLRGFLARQHLRRLRREHKSAISIQRVARGRKGRLETAERRQRRDAAVLVQRNVRGRQARHQVAIMRVQLLRMQQEQAAICIQRHARGFFVRRDIREHKCQAAALAIQCAWRSSRARFELKRLELEREQRLQAEEAARLQAIADERAALERRSAVTIQCRWRQYRSKHELRKRRLGRARKLRQQQRQRILDLEHASATRIQRLVRSRITNAASTKRLRAQRCARGFLSRRCLQTRRLERSSAVRIQRAFRYFTVKRKLSMLIELDNESKGHWVELFDEASGFVYYYNTETKMSSWDKPLELTSRPNDGYDEQQNQEEPEWVEYWDENVGASYYYNIKTGEATWSTPAGVIAAAASYDNQALDDQGSSQEYWYGGYGTDGREALYNTLPDKAKGRIAQAMEYQLSPENDPWADVAVVEEGYDNNLDEYAAYDYDYGEDTAADTEYDINYKIYMTQLDDPNQNEPEDQSEQQQEDGAKADESTE